MPEKLKPCPFCGGEVKIYNMVSNIAQHLDGFLTLDGECYAVRCDDCNCEISFISAAASEEQTTQAWNRRTESDL